MELAQKYALTVYRQKSFSGAAKKLFISQPSLSAMIKKLEGELGFAIFDRKKSPVVLTPEGRIYIAYLEEAFENEKIMLGKVKAISRFSGSEITVGGGNYFAKSILPLACRIFCDRFPHTAVTIDMNDTEPSNSSVSKLVSGSNDLAIKYTKDPRITCLPLTEETFYIALRKDAPGAGQVAKYALTLDEILSGDEPSCASFPTEAIPRELKLIYPRSLSKYFFDSPEYLSRFSMAKCHVMNSKNRGIYYDMMLCGLGGTLVTDMMAAVERRRSDDVIFLPVNAECNKRTSYIAYKDESLISNEARGFISVLLELCEDKQKLYGMLAR
jgi:DNA-binding transcriptional LysR family regulator